MTKKARKTWENFENDTGRCREPTKWKLKRTWSLKKCKLTGDLILPGTKGWCKTYYNWYNGTPAFSNWVCETAYTFERLKGTGRLDSDL